MPYCSIGHDVPCGQLSGQPVPTMMPKSIIQDSPVQVRPIVVLGVFYIYLLLQQVLPAKGKVRQVRTLLLGCTSPRNGQILGLPSLGPLLLLPPPFFLIFYLCPLFLPSLSATLLPSYLFYPPPCVCRAPPPSRGPLFSSDLTPPSLPLWLCCLLISGGRPLCGIPPST